METKQTTPWPTVELADIRLPAAPRPLDAAANTQEREHAGSNKHLNAASPRVRSAFLTIAKFLTDCEDLRSTPVDYGDEELAAKSNALRCVLLADAASTVLEEADPRATPADLKRGPFRRLLPPNGVMKILDGQTISPTVAMGELLAARDELAELHKKLNLAFHPNDKSLLWDRVQEARYELQAKQNQFTLQKKLASGQTLVECAKTLRESLARLEMEKIPETLKRPIAALQKGASAAKKGEPMPPDIRTLLDSVRLPTSLSVQPPARRTRSAPFLGMCGYFTLAALKTVPAFLSHMLPLITVFPPAALGALALLCLAAALIYLCNCSFPLLGMGGRRMGGSPGLSASQKSVRYQRDVDQCSQQVVRSSPSTLAAPQPQKDQKRTALGGSRQCASNGAAFFHSTDRAQYLPQAEAPSGPCPDIPL